MQAQTSTNRNNSGEQTVIEFSLRARNPKTLRLAATHITANLDETQNALSKRIAKIAGLPLDRLRVTFENSQIVLDKRFHPDSPPKVRDVSGQGTVLVVKDLGPQASWRLVYVIEYIGPILFHPIFYYYQNLFYGRTFEHSWAQTMTMWMVVLHFIKREFETLCIHRFSSDTMPLPYIFRNSAHYWALAGIVFGYIMYLPEYSTLHRTPLQTTITLILYAYFELSNLYTHITLRNLRPEGTRVRQVPRGYGFDWPFGGISCANYFFEILAWIVIGMWSGCIGVLPFLAVAVFIMDRWAQQKHRKYRHEFANYPRRSAIFPFVR